jgi:hypothetical protein
MARMCERPELALVGTQVHPCCSCRSRKSGLAIQRHGSAEETCGKLVEACRCGTPETLFGARKRYNGTHYGPSRCADKWALQNCDRLSLFGCTALP